MKPIFLIILLMVITLSIYPIFVDVTDQAVPEDLRGAYSVAWVDINNNGLQDAFVAPYYFYLNNGDGTFTAKEFAEFTDWGISNNTRVAFADANNSGFVDMVISDHRHTTEERTYYVYFFENRGPPNFNFEGQKIYELPLNIKGGQPMFLDINGNGKMEIYLATFGNWQPNYAVGMDQLFSQNDQGGWDNITNEHIPELANTNNHRPSRGVNSCDYNMNFAMDIFVPVYSVGSFNAANFLWKNDGHGYFTDYAEEAGVDIEPHCRYELGLASGAAFGDFNNNGWFDLSVANIHGWPALYENQGDGTYKNVTAGRGLDEGVGGTPQEKQWHNANWIDHNNNGYLDLWLTQWYGNEGFFCFVYENQGPENPGQFKDVTEQIGFNKRREFNDIHGLAAGDFNGNGFLDILMHSRAGYDTEYRGNYIFKNQGNDNNWMQIKLQGDGSNVTTTSAGSQARLFYSDGTASYIRQVESTSSDQSMHQHVLHYGLGERDELQQIMVRWTDGTTEYFHGEDYRQVNRLITIEYGTGTETSNVLAVRQDYEGTSDGTVYHPYTSIQEAVDIANSGDIIKVFSGYYFENIDLSGKRIKLIAAGKREDTNLMGRAMHDAKVTFRGTQNDDAMIKGFTIMGELGGGISITNASPKIIDCLLNLNQADEGAAIYLNNSQAEIINCEIVNNNADSGGAIFAVDSDIKIERSYFRNNRAANGAVIKGSDSHIRIINSLVVKNISTQNGVILLESGSLRMDFCTLNQNSHGLSLLGSSSANGWSITNSIIYNNGEFELRSDEAINIRHSNISTPTGGEGNISKNPFFLDDEEEDNKWRLTPFSPCIGAGIDTGIAEDFSGSPRPQPGGSNPDMGCFEHERSAPAPMELHVATTGSNDDGDGSLANPYATINHTIQNSLGGEKIVVAPGTYYENIDLQGKESMIVSLFYTTGARERIFDTIIDGGGIGPVVRFESGESSRAGLKGFTLTNGRHANGAGLLINSAEPVISNVRVMNSTASVNGGGVFIQNSNAVLRDLIIANNEAGNFGAGMFVMNSRLVLEGIDIHQNQARLNGGLTANSSQIVGRHITIADNQAVADNPQTGGILSINSSIYLVNSILWNNMPGQTAKMMDGTIDIFYSNVYEGYEGEGNIEEDPLFLDTENNDYRLSSGSPCIDAGIAKFSYNDMSLINLPPTSYSGEAPDMGAHDLLFADIDEEQLLLPTDALALEAYPNPFNPDITISLSLPVSAKTSVSIYNIRGRLVNKPLAGEYLNAGEHHIVFNGRDKEGNTLPSGIYLVNLVSGDHSKSVKIMMMK